MANSSTHVIRLRGPWDVTPISRVVVTKDGACKTSVIEAPVTARQTMPADWSEQLGPDFFGRVRYVRTFQMPTGLVPSDTVSLVVEPPRSIGTVTLAETNLGTVVADGPVGRFDITGLLADRNRLEIVVEHLALDEHGSAHSANSQLAGGLVGEVRLEIVEGSG
jgi:hypothetical protein